jgi:hypothetical protein
LKKEITIATCSAVALIILLGSVSYLLFPKVSVQAYTASIDAYTQRGGKGSNTAGGNFFISQNDTVYIYAEVRNASNVPQGSRLIAYEIHWPANGSQNGITYGAPQTAVTNASGIAEIARIPIWALQVQGRDPRGNWLVYVTTSIDDQVVVDTLTFSVQ